MPQTMSVRKSFQQMITDVMPRGAGALFFIQMFSTLAFSVLYSTLVLYATSGLHLSDRTANGITTSFIAFNYALHLLGGYVGGRFFSYRALFSIGMGLQIVGCALIAIPSLTSLYWGLAAFLTGAGLNVTCINCMMTQLFRPEDKRREAAFLWNYSGMNVGFFVGFTVSGWLQLRNGYHALFMFAACGNLLALFLMLMHWKKLDDSQTILKRLSPALRVMARTKGTFLIILLVLGLRFLLENAAASNQLIMVAGIVMMGFIAFLAVRQPAPEASRKLWGYLILSCASIAFWTLYQMAPMGLMLFIQRNVDRHFMGFVIAPQWVQNINTFVIILGGPLLSVLFNVLRDYGVRITLPLQFGIALLCIGAALAILPVGIRMANPQGLTSFSWILGCFALQSIGELFISPIGYAMVGQLVPVPLQGVLMGTWMMMTGIAATLSGYFSDMALSSVASVDPVLTNPGFAHTFGMLGWSAVAVGILLLLVMPGILKLTQERKIRTEEKPRPQSGSSPASSIPF